ncbi:MAG: PP0621 family protein [Burkholderiales bacterium]
MGKYLFLLLLGVAAWWALRVLWRAKHGSGGAANAPAPEDMVRCAQCGVHLPRSESLLRGGRLFCSEEHVRLTE